MNIGITKAIATQAAKDEIAKGGLVIDNVARTGLEEVKSQLDEIDKSPNFIMNKDVKFLKKDDTTATILKKYNTEKEIRIKYGIDSTKNINNLPNFMEIVTLANTNELPSNNWNGAGTFQLYHYGTDFLGPYIVRADNNGDGDKVGSGGAFTGGFHGYNGNIGVAGNSATARNLFFKAYIDEVESPSGKINFGNNVRLEFKNRVQGWNTKKVDGSGREILEETYTINIVNDLIYIKCTIMALEDITIDTYYGFQNNLSPIDANTKIFMVNATGVNANKWFNYNDSDFDTGSILSGSQCNDILISKNNDDFKMHLFIKNKKGLANRENVATNNPTFKFINGTKKLYSNLIIEKPLMLKRNEIVEWEGGYRLY